MVLVTGASGQVGCAVIRALSQKGIPTKAWIHRSSNEQKVRSAGATETFVGDMNDEKDLREAMCGVDAVYFICSAANPNEDKIGEKMILAAKETGGIYFVYHSVLHSVLQDMPHHKKKLMVEQMLVDSGLMYTIIQPAVFMQMFAPALKSVQNGGPLLQKFYASNHTRMSFVDMTDMAEAAAIVLSGKEYVNATLELCGTESYSLDDVVDIFSRAAGRAVNAQFIPDDIFLKQAGHESPDSYPAKTLLTMFQHYNTHSFCGNSFVISQILGRKPHRLHQFVEEHLNKE